MYYCLGPSPPILLAVKRASRDTREVSMPRPLLLYFAEKNTRDLRLARDL